MKRIILTAPVAAILFTAILANTSSNYHALAQQEAGVQSVYFVQEMTGQLGFGHSATGLVECPDGSTQGGFILFDFRAFKPAGDENVTGSWAAQIFELFRLDEGSLTELSVDENGFEAKGSMEGGFITSTTSGDKTATGETTIMCEGTPIDEDTTVTISGQCGQDVDMSFEASNGITGTFVGDTTCTTGDTSEPVTITFTSQEGPSSIEGMWVSIYADDGSLLTSGFTPLTFNGSSSTMYRVAAADYAGLEHLSWNTGQPNWDGNSEDETRAIITSSDMNITANYLAEVFLVMGYTELTNNAIHDAPELTVRAALSDTSEPLSMWTIIQAIEGSQGQQTYRVHTHNYQDLVFDHWEDGSTNMVRDITIGDNTTITAYYNTR